jgi:peptide-methionine (S)-S-oxide reductase
MNKNDSNTAAAAAAQAKPLDLAPSEGRAYAVLAGGCFWCLEAVFEQVPGVSSVISGYTGGATARPSYEEVSSGATGHAEAVAIAFDPAAVSYDELLDYFWKIHDPTTKDRQGADVGTQYRSVIYYVDEAQRATAEASIARETARWPSPIVTELKPAGDFWAAEDYHQDFYRNNPNYGYCAVVIAPKLRKAGF